MAKTVDNFVAQHFRQCTDDIKLNSSHQNPKPVASDPSDSEDDDEDDVKDIAIIISSDEEGNTAENVTRSCSNDQSSQSWNNRNARSCGPQKHETNQNDWQCETCERRFRKVYGAAYLAMHRKTHLHLYPFHCRICLHKFDDSNGKNEHETKCKLKRFECFLCHYITAYKSNLLAHMRKHSGEKPPLKQQFWDRNLNF